MRFSSVMDTYHVSDSASLKAEYAEAEEFSPARIGTKHVFFRSSLRMRYLPLHAITRVFRRVEFINASMGCCENSLPMDSVILCVGEGQEVAQIRMQSERMSKALLAALEKACPHAESGYVRDPSQKSAIRYI